LILWYNQTVELLEETLIEGKRKMSKKVEILAIDPQDDFCNPNGALFVPGADADMSRAAAMIKRIMPRISDIHVTLDSHHNFDVAHPMYWKDTNGNHPDPFTIISASDVENGIWTPTVPSLYKRSLEYVKALETNQRYPLCIWPPHCIIGSKGHAVVPELFEVLSEWETTQTAMVDYVTKGSNVYTEHYSAVVADCPDPSDPGTQINTKLINTLVQADIIIALGEAGSHCLSNTLMDIANNFGDDSYISKIVLITDATSPVPGFEHLQDDFIKNMTGRGMQTALAADILR